MIVVPLDGSKVAECVLAHVEELAKGAGAREVILVRVTDYVIGHAALPEPARPIEAFPIPATIPPSEAVARLPVAVSKKREQAERYLNGIAKRLAETGIKVRCEVLLGHPAKQITVFAEKTGADLIAMASHGRSLLSRWAFGSVADKVFRASSIPVLMVRASQPENARTHIERSISYRNQGDYRRAEIELDEARKLAPSMAWLYQTICELGT